MFWVFFSLVATVLLLTSCVVAARASTATRAQRKRPSESPWAVAEPREYDEDRSCPTGTDQRERDPSDLTTGKDERPAEPAAALAGEHPVEGRSEATCQAE
jgi:hypothetical protein